MKIEDLELYLSNIVGSYYAVREKLMENDDEYHSRIDTPISTEGIIALKDVLARIRKRYQEPSAADLEWPENLMFDIGFDLSIRVTEKQMAGIEYVLTLLTDEESGTDCKGKPLKQGKGKSDKGTCFKEATDACLDAHS